MLTLLRSNTHQQNKQARGHPKSTMYKDSAPYCTTEDILWRISKIHRGTPAVDKHCDEYHCEADMKHKAPHNGPLKPPTKVLLTLSFELQSRF